MCGSVRYIILIQIYSDILRLYIFRTSYNVVCHCISHLGMLYYCISNDLLHNPISMASPGGMGWGALVPSVRSVRSRLGRTGCHTYCKTVLLERYCMSSKCWFLIFEYDFDLKHNSQFYRSFPEENDEIPNANQNEVFTAKNQHCWSQTTISLPESQQQNRRLLNFERSNNEDQQGPKGSNSDQWSYLDQLDSLISLQIWRHKHHTEKTMEFFKPTAVRVEHDLTSCHNENPLKWQVGLVSNNYVWTVYRTQVVASETKRFSDANPWIQIALRCFEAGTFHRCEFRHRPIHGNGTDVFFVAKLTDGCRPQHRCSRFD